MEEKLKKLEENISGVAQKLNLKIYDIIFLREGGYNYLQIFIENQVKETDLDDCVNFSNEIDEIVDKIFDEKFFLEVSSPGIEKKLRKKEHFLDVVTKEISLKTKSNIEGQKRFKGILQNVLENSITIFDEKLQKNVEIEISKIIDAKLESKLLVIEEE